MPLAKCAYAYTARTHICAASSGNFSEITSDDNNNHSIALRSLWKFFVCAPLCFHPFAILRRSPFNCFDIEIARHCSLYQTQFVVLLRVREEENWRVSLALTKFYLIFNDSRNEMK